MLKYNTVEVGFGRCAEHIELPEDFQRNQFRMLIKLLMGCSGYIDMNETEGGWMDGVQSENPKAQMYHPIQFRGSPQFINHYIHLSLQSSVCITHTHKHIERERERKNNHNIS